MSDVEVTTPQVGAPDHRMRWAQAAPFLLVNFAPLLVFLTGVTTKALILGIVLYVARAFGITAGYHRYFAHRTYKMSRVPQFLMALLGASAVQKGPLWWAANHRAHHRYTDTERDPHSPAHGFFWSHMGWIVSDRFDATDYDAIPDFAKYPELVWLNKRDWVAPWALGALCFLIAGWSGLVVGFFCSTVALWHATFAVNSVAHLWGRRHFATGDTSRNNPIVALLTLGEGWHNNHHHYPRSVRQGFRWYEIDISYGLLRVLSWLRVAKDLQQPPAAALTASRIRDGHPDLGMLRYRLGRAARKLRGTRASEELTMLLENTAQQAAAIARRGRVTAAVDEA